MSDYFFRLSIFLSILSMSVWIFLRVFLCFETLTILKICIAIQMIARIPIVWSHRAIEPKLAIVSFERRRFSKAIFICGGKNLKRCCFFVGCR